MATGIAEFAEIVACWQAITAYIDGDGASAAYWIAAAADEVVVSKTAMVGSVGAVVGVDTRKPDGLVEIVSSQSPNKRPDVTTDEGKKQVQTRIDALAQVFVEDVATYRGVTVNTVLEKFGQEQIGEREQVRLADMANRVSTFEALISKLTGATNGSNTTMTTASNHRSGRPAPIATTPTPTPGDFESLAGMTPDAVEKTAANWWEQVP
ncbi:S49 family peptidase [Thiohalophilus sp.]|uniref:S49 family peptidase n=1 Tax=Thiohalophilus sp. TaxID=3028392 RepID=UPI002ACEF871|nr:S49 family peptidase [Thiohalophilus sp.]MDZ7804301.1 S49 family peptidase [Thiohalophilus sp.]